MNSPFDPKPSIKIENGVITEMDGKCRADFDMLDTFIADHAIRLGNAEKAMAMDSLEIARKIVDINVSREEILDITLSLTPAKLTEVVGKLNIVEIMMGMTKMRARMMPANQCHVTNVRDNPVQIAADAAEAGVRASPRWRPPWPSPVTPPSTPWPCSWAPGGPPRCHDPVRPGGGHRAAARHARLHHLRGDHLRLRHRARLHGRRRHPLLQGVPASCYASRGLKMRFTSGTGSEVQMGYAEGKSMLYLEARCLAVTSAGVQVRRTAPCPASACPPAYPAHPRRGR